MTLGRESSALSALGPYTAKPYTPCLVTGFGRQLGRISDDAMITISRYLHLFIA